MAELYGIVAPRYEKELSTFYPLEQRKKQVRPRLQNRGVPSILEMDVTSYLTLYITSNVVPSWIGRVEHV